MLNCIICNKNTNTIFNAYKTETALIEEKTNFLGDIERVHNITNIQPVKFGFCKKCEEKIKRKEFLLFLLTVSIGIPILGLSIVSGIVYLILCVSILLLVILINTFHNANEKIEIRALRYAKYQDHSLMSDKQIEDLSKGKKINM